MNRPNSILILVAMVAASVPWPAGAESARTQSSRSSSVPAYDVFRIVVSRNIFDRDRRRPPAPGEYRRPVRTERRPEPERVSLVGVWINRANGDAQIVAFFDGSNSDYNTTAGPGDTIADLRVSEVRTDFVKLEKNGKPILLPVGLALSRADEKDDWRLASRSEPSSRRESSRGRPESPSRRDSYRSRPEPARPESGTDGEAAETAGSGDSADDILKKLMERRKKEMER